MKRRGFLTHQRGKPPMRQNPTPAALEHQYELAIAHAPRKVRQFGLRDAHSWPLVSRGKLDGQFQASFRVSPWQAWDYPSLELRAANSWPAIILDCDARAGTLRLCDAYLNGRVPWPNWIVTRESSGGSHGVWCLARPVHRGEKARQAPLRALARAAEFMAGQVGADRGYTGVLSHNPMAKGHGAGLRTTWGRREPYGLNELAKIIPLGWRRPKIPSTGIGRNCGLFEALMRWAGRQENAQIAALTAAHVANEAYRDHPLGPVGPVELRGIAASVEGYRRRWAARGWHRPEWLARQRARGTRSGAARRARTAERDVRIVEAVLQGESLRAVARVHGLTARTVHHIYHRDAPLFGGRYTNQHR